MNFKKYNFIFIGVTNFFINLVIFNDIEIFQQDGRTSDVINKVSAC